MELNLSAETCGTVTVLCNGSFSHRFELATLIQLPGASGRPPQPRIEPEVYGTAVFQTLFPAGSIAGKTLEAEPERILLVCADQELQAVPWEYACGPESFLVLDFPFVRGRPADQRIDPPVLEAGLHIVAVPSNPISRQIEPLNIEGEWRRLVEAVEALPFALTLERVRPPTIDRLRSLLANQRGRVVHFMGHGGGDEQQANLLFEKEKGEPQEIKAKDFYHAIRGSVFLVTLNACVSATPGETEFSNLAHALVQRKVPYALGMRFSIPDQDALTFGRVLYDELARGTAVEEAVFHARRSLARDNPRQWVVGVPVLYTSLKAPAGGFKPAEGKPAILDYQSKTDVAGLPKAEGAFQGRVDELLWLGEKLTGEQRPRVTTIHGAGGQGKTALAREAVERFAWAWPGGVFAVSLENLPERAAFVAQLARFLGIPTDQYPDLDDIERLAVAALSRRQVLIVLDNAETFTQAVDSRDQRAIELAGFLKERLTGTLAGLLVTSREYLGWPDETGFNLGGLSPQEGGQLFRQQPRGGRETSTRQGRRA